MPDLPTTRAEALSLGLPRYFTGKPCKSGHVAARHTTNYTCAPCGTEGKRRHYRENREAKSERDRQYREANREAVLERHRRYRSENPDKVTAARAARRARQIKATPSWADRGMIKWVYEIAADETGRTGEPHHVDHVVPLKGASVCGLHVPWNLRIITATANIAKGNDMPPEKDWLA